MVPVTSLWLPILLSAVIVFVASSILHMVLRYHRTDFAKLPAEDEIADALRKNGVAPGDYMFPYAEGPAAMKDPAFLEKRKRGPIGVLTVIPGGSVSMAPYLAQWFVYCVVVGVFAAYVAGRALAPGAPYPSVFRFAGCTAFVAYSLALWQNSIWYRRKWSTTIKSNFDGLLYGLLTAGTFGWLWPR
ncbi:MAG TPA: hypothetical protein VFW15_13095 [Thermoanaerobaculia bacterium]|jgi:hypothetical protein|nr:hypothetical protein [Thermoanaerobaculia bacterium]